jgi:hypothetical protein
MGGTLDYGNSRLMKQRASIKSENEKALIAGGQFPNCKGLYPDCPEKPSFLEAKCRNCPKTEDVKKPRLEWVECEHCKDEGVPVIEGTKKENIEETKCHCCGKISSKEYIKSKIN